MYPRAGNLDASLHFTAHISYDSLLIAGSAVYGLNRAIPNDRPQTLPLVSLSVYATGTCCTLARVGANRDAARPQDCVRPPNCTKRTIVYDGCNLNSEHSGILKLGKV